jgi:hypothetical protein
VGFSLGDIVREQRTHRAPGSAKLMGAQKQLLMGDEGSRTADLADGRTQDQTPRPPRSSFSFNAGRDDRKMTAEPESTPRSSINRDHVACQGGALRPRGVGLVGKGAKVNFAIIPPICGFYSAWRSRRPF